MFYATGVDYEGAKLQVKQNEEKQFLYTRKSEQFKADMVRSEEKLFLFRNLTPVEEAQSKQDVTVRAPNLFKLRILFCLYQKCGENVQEVYVNILNFVNFVLKSLIFSLRFLCFFFSSAVFVLFIRYSGCFWKQLSF